MANLKSLVTAVMLATTVPAWADVWSNQLRNDTVTEISQVLDYNNNPNNNPNNNALFSDELVNRMDIEKKVNEVIKDERMKELVKFYWEDEVRNRIREMVQEIIKNPDKYWMFDSKWEMYFVGRDGVLFKDSWMELFDYTFRELTNEEKKRKLTYELMGMVVLACILYAILDGTERQL